MTNKLRLHILSFKPGGRIITKDDPADCAYMIVSGRVRVFIEKDSKIVDLATLGEGEIFGETAFFKDGLYGAHVEAIEETGLAAITPDTLQEKMESCDPMIRSVLKMLIRRLSNTNAALLKSEARELIEIDWV